MAAPDTLERFSKIHDLKKKRKAFLDQLGDLSKWGVTKNYVLVAVYIGGDKIAGSTLYRSANSLKEDIYQGTAGLLVKCGPTAFKEKSNGKLVDEQERPAIGEWVTFVPGEGKRIQINGIDCRYFDEDAILGTTPNPEQITYRQ